MSTGRKTLTNSCLYISKCECPDNHSGDNVHFDSGWIMNLEIPKSLCEALRGSGSKLSATGISATHDMYVFSPRSDPRINRPVDDLPYGRRIVGVSSAERITNWYTATSKQTC